ncbi:MAG: dGTP triphosphohydrolase, partial [Pseudomonadota bacterium]
AHDLGHTPFGHTGEDALDALMAPFGGFDHNAQTIRIVTRLERHYAAFDGLNLTWETLEGIAKHNGPVAAPLPYGLAEYARAQDLELGTHASAEAQAAAIADDIAYNNHDLHDGLRAGLFTDAEIEALPMVGPAYGEVQSLWPGLDPKRRRHEALRRVFGAMVSDVIDAARVELGTWAPGAGGGAVRLSDVAEVRALGRAVVGFSSAVQADVDEIRAFLFARMYRADRVMRVRAEVTGVIEDLFALFMAEPGHLPASWQAELARVETPADLARHVADYIAGMTDRFALQQHAALCGGTVLTEAGAASGRDPTLG